MPRIAPTALAFTLLLVLHIATVLAIVEQHQQRAVLPHTEHFSIPMLSHR